eukprot:1515121-Rhodomonas_salina.1
MPVPRRAAAKRRPAQNLAKGTRYEYLSTGHRYRTSRSKGSSSIAYLSTGTAKHRLCQYRTLRSTCVARSVPGIV